MYPFAIPEKQSLFSEDYLPPDIKIINELNSLIELQFRKHRSAEFYASKLNVSINVLNRITKAHLQKTAYELIQERIHEEATKLLIHTTISAKEITYQLGLPDPPYFFRCFKRLTGMRPREYRKWHQTLK